MPGAKRKERIAVIGLGFVGLTTALGFGHKGFRIRGFDVSEPVRTALRKGRVLFHEPYLAEQLRSQLDQQQFVISGALKEAIADADVIFYCVGTPSRASGEVDPSYLVKAIKSTLACLPRDRHPTLVVKSTVPPGTMRKRIQPVFRLGGRETGSNIGLASNPEFLREGFAWEDFTQPDRIVIGAEEETSSAAVARLYNAFTAPIHRVSLSTAEFIKSASNALLGTLISFANECSIIADRVGDIDVRHAFEVLHQDRRWSGNPARMTSYVFPGCGFGGYCLPKDIAALLYTAKSAGAKADLLKGVVAVNSEIRRHFVGKIVAATNPRSRIGILGLSFKPGSDDVRDTPAAHVIDLLRKNKRSNLLAYDPMANETYQRAYRHPIEYAGSVEEIVKEADVYVVLTAWPEFKAKKALLSGKPLFDGRYCM